LIQSVADTKLTSIDSIMKKLTAEHFGVTVNTAYS